MNSRSSNSAWLRTTVPHCACSPVFRLFENVTDVLFAVEVGQSLAADDVLGPLSCHEVIEEVDVERASAIIDKRLDVVFQRLATFFVVQVVVVVVPVMVVMVVVFVVMALLSLNGRNP